MPGRDQSGPGGQGPMTGQRMGICAGRIRPGRRMAEHPGSGWSHRGTRHGMGYGNGHRHGYGMNWDDVEYVSREPDSSQTEIKHLEREVTSLSEQLEKLKSRLSDLLDDKTE